MSSIIDSMFKSLELVELSDNQTYSFDMITGQFYAVYVKGDNVEDKNNKARLNLYEMYLKKVEDKILISTMNNEDTYDLEGMKLLLENNISEIRLELVKSPKEILNTIRELRNKHKDNGDDLK